MASHKSAIKRDRQNKVRRLRNKSNRTRMKNVIKCVRAAIHEKSTEEAKTALAEAIPIIQQAANKGSIHRRNASRKISRLTRQVNTITA